MRLGRFHLAVFAVVFACSKCFAWGAQGHEVVGAIADELLKGTPAGSHVEAILHIPLREAATWPDCVRSVVEKNGSFTYKPAKKEYEAPCVWFQTTAGKKRMDDYARRNWAQCKPAPGEHCHEMYHFDDVATQHDHYSRTFVGTSNHDIVSAMSAAIDVLQGKHAPAPFSIKDKEEALLLLAHFVGDVHQPLHVGAVYLKPNGDEIDPDAAKPFDVHTETHGGNWIDDGVEHKSNLHSAWDEIPGGIAPTSVGDLVTAARAVPPTPGAIGTWPAAWATDTVLASHDAFKGTSFAGAGKPDKWKVTFADLKTYQDGRDALQRAQLAKPGARLAQLLEAIWPPTT